MYIHIGNDFIIKKEEIIFILDYEKLIQNKTFNKFMENIDKNRIIDISQNKPKSILIIENKNKIKAYISNISSSTLGKRNI